MRIALCIRGLSCNVNLDRTNGRVLFSYDVFENNEGLADLAKNGEVDVFVYTWNKGNIDKIKTYLNPKKLVVQEVDDEVRKTVLDIENYPHREIYLEQREIYAKFSNYYALKEVDKLRIEYQNEHNFEYDCVIHTRFDVIFRFLTPLANFDLQNNIYIPDNANNANKRPHRYYLGYVILSSGKLIEKVTTKLYFELEGVIEKIRQARKANGKSAKLNNHYILGFFFDNKPYKKNIIRLDRDKGIHVSQKLHLIPNYLKKEKYYLSATTVFRDESDYMKEWLDFHLLIGVQHFYLYDNRSKDNIMEVLQPYIDKKLVTYNYWDKDLRDKPRYEYTRHCLKNYGSETKWLAVISNDEFIYPVDKNTNIKKILKEYEQYALYRINWKCFGDNFQDHKTDEYIIKRFTKRGTQFNVMNYVYKCIIQPNMISDVLSSHDFVIKPGCKIIYDSTLKEEDVLSTEDKIKLNEEYKKIYNKVIFKKSIAPSSGGRCHPLFNKIAMNHYMIMSKEEFENKYEKMKSVVTKNRGDSEIFQKFRSLLNQVDDTELCDRYYSNLKNFDLDNINE